MSYFQNVETSNLRDISNFPFTDTSSLEVGKYKFPAPWISSLRLQVQNAVFPLHIGNIHTDDVFIVLSVVDNTGTSVCDIKIAEQACFIVDSFNKIAGQIQVDGQLYSWLYKLIKNSVYGYMQLKSDALVIASQVIACVYFQGYTGLSVNNTYIGQDVILNFQRNIETIRAGSNLRLNVYGDYSYSYQNQRKLQVVNGKDLRGKDLLIQHSMLSDLRVSTQSGKISFIGVTDAT